MRISHRLYLTTMPAVVAALLMGSLFYWGQYAREAPEVVLVSGVLAVLATFALAWNNARYVARRIERLARRTGTSDDGGDVPDPKPVIPSTGAPALVADEIDAIEHAMYRLSTAVELAEMNRADREEMYQHRAHDYARLLLSIADASARRFEEVRLPLHILLENRFGELNENQEEMLGAARAAAEAADADMLSLRQIAALDLGDRPMRRDRIKPSELIDALRPMLTAAADSREGTVHFDVAPLLPAVLGDRAMLHDAVVTLLRGAVEDAPLHAAMRLGVERHETAIRISMHGAGSVPPTVRWAAAVRVVQAHGGSVRREPDELRIELPVYAVK